MSLIGGFTPFAAFLSMQSPEGMEAIAWRTMPFPLPSTPAKKSSFFCSVGIKFTAPFTSEREGMRSPRKL